MSRCPDNSCINKELNNKCGGEGGIIRRLRRLTPFGAARRLRRLRVLSPPDGGSSRILDELLTHTHFPSVLLKPLGHLSVTIEGNPTIRTPASESVP